MAEIPEEILRRSAEAKAKATGRPVEEILAELRGEAAAPQAAASAAPEAAVPQTAPPDSLKGKAQAAAAALPEHLLRRSAEAKAKALGVPVADIIAEMTGSAAGAAPPPADPSPSAGSAPVAPAATGEIDWEAAGVKAGMPEKLLRRSVEAKANAAETTHEAILTEMLGDIPRISEEPAADAPVSPETAAPAPAAAPASTEIAAPAPAPTAPAAPAASGPVDWEAAAAAAGMSAKLLQRSAEAKAKALGRPVAEIVAEMTGVAPAAGTAPAAAPAPAVAAAPAAAAPARSNLPPVPEGVNTQRLLTVVQAEAIQGARKEPVDKVNVWPHLLAIEFVALLVVLALLVVFSVFQDAPLLELANPNAQPNPSKAPWYFLGLQELLSYFDPQVAGVLIPGLGLAGLAIIPYIDRNPSTKPANRKFAIMVFTFFVVAAAILTIIGSFYRGKGFNFTFPWRDGIFFDL